MKTGLRHVMMSAVIALIISETAFATEHDKTHEVPPMLVIKSSRELQISTTCGPKDDTSKRMTLNYTRVAE